MINGVLVFQKKKIIDERGMVLHMLRRDDPNFVEFGEIYFSVINPGVVKAWHMHRKMDLNYVCVKGMIKLVLYDERENSPTYKMYDEFYIGDDDYKLIHIPKLVWNGFKNIGQVPAIVANCATMPHDPEELVRVPPHNTHSFVYDWTRKDG